MEQVTGIEPVSLPWQGSVIATILYLQITDIIGNDLPEASKLLSHANDPPFLDYRIERTHGRDIAHWKFNAFHRGKNL